MVSMDTFMIAKSMAANNRDAAEAYENYIASLNQQIEDLQIALAIEQCAHAGTRGELATMKGYHKDSKFNGLTEMKFADGTAKTFGQVVYEVYFDRKAKEIGLQNPEKYRKA